MLIEKMCEIKNSFSKPNKSSEIKEQNNNVDYSECSFLPIKKENLIKFYYQQRDLIWFVQEFTIKDDRRDWDRLDDNTKRYIKFLLCFFSQFDGLINENIIDNFKRETSNYKEAKYFYSVQEFIENIHNEAYSLLIDVFIRDDNEKQKALNAIHYYKPIQELSNWLVYWMNDSIPLMERIIAFACVEGIFFSSAFAGIYWIKRKNILKGLCKANEFIARDEGIHTEFAIELYKTYVSDRIYSPVSNERIKEIISSAVDAVSNFTEEALNVDLVGLDCKDMIKYIKCTSDYISNKFCGEKIYNIQNPFDWMAVLGLDNKTNYFESEVSEYAQCDISGKLEETDDF